MNCTIARKLGTLLKPHAAIWAGSIALSAMAISMGLALTAVSGWLIVRASIEEHIMVLMVAIVGVRAFGIFRSVGRYADRLVTHEAAFRVIDDLQTEALALDHGSRGGVTSPARRRRTARLPRDGRR